MPSVSCPGCGRRILLSVDDLRKTIACVRCGTHFDPVRGTTVEPPLVAGDGPEPEPGPGPESSYDPEYDTAARPSLAPVFAIAGMLAIVGLVAIVVAVVKSSGDKPAVVKKEPPAKVRREEPPVRYADPTTPSPDTVLTTVFTWVAIATVLSILYVVGVVLMLAWVAKDAKNRGIDGGAMGVLVIVFTHWVGLLVYLASRPTGTLGTCANCQNQRLLYAKHCPHCGHA